MWGGGGVGEAGGGGGGGRVADQSGFFTTHLFCFESAQSCRTQPTPLLLHPLALILLPPLQSQYFPSPPPPPPSSPPPPSASSTSSSSHFTRTHTPYSAEHSTSLPPAVSWSSFLSPHTLESCVSVRARESEHCRRDVVCAVADSCASREARAQTTAGFYLLSHRN